MQKLPKRCGINLNPQHYEELLNRQNAAEPRKPAWLEVLPENYLGAGGAPHYFLEKLAGAYPISFGGGILSLASAESPHQGTLDKVAHLVEKYQPSGFTELLSWTRWQGTYLKQPMPFPFTFEALDQVSLNIKTVQNTLGRRILLENCAGIVAFEQQDLTEEAFFHELVRATGCGIALNITNLYISNLNAGRDPFKALQGLPLAAVRQIKLGGQKSTASHQDQLVLTNDPESTISSPVWRLYQTLLCQMLGPVSTSVEWRGSAADLDSLLDIAEQADDLMFEAHPASNSGGRT